MLLLLLYFYASVNVYIEREYVTIVKHCDPA